MSFRHSEILMFPLNFHIATDCAADAFLTISGQQEGISRCVLDVYSRLVLGQPKFDWNERLRFSVP